MRPFVNLMIINKA